MGGTHKNAGSRLKLLCIVSQIGLGSLLCVSATSTFACTFTATVSGACLLGRLGSFFTCPLVPEDWSLEQLFPVCQYSRVASRRPVTGLGADMPVLVY